MIVWDDNINEQEIMQQEDQEIIIDFGDLFVINSSEIRKLLIIQKDCERKGKKLTFKTPNNYLRDLFKELGFDELGIHYQ